VALVTAPRPVSVVTIGEPLVAFIATDGPLASAGAYTCVVTGAEVNVAIGVARLGHSVDLIGLVGDDGLGQRVLRALRAEGIGIEHLQVVPDTTTGILVREPSTFGPAEVTYRREGSAGARLSIAEVEEAAGPLAGATWLHITGITPALSESCVQAVDRAVDLARAGRARVSLDVNMRRKLWSEKRAHETLQRLLGRCDLVFGDRAELCMLAGVSSVADSIAVLHSHGIEDVVEKRAAEGATIFGRDGSRRELPPVPVAYVLDAVGAGDAFVSGYLAADIDWRVDGAVPTMQPAYELASLSASYALTAVGDTTGAPMGSRVADHARDVAR
jgi:2-dehydro-3-deoxygluconokinase